MRYLSLIFASMLLVGCAQSTDVDSTQDVDIQSQEQTAEPEVDTEEQQPEETTEDSFEADESTEDSSTETNSTESGSTESESNETNSTESGSTETSSSDAQETEQAPEPEPEPEPEPAPEPVEEAEPEPTGFTLAMVQENDDASSCWSVINGNVYDLTAWINQHPGGSSRILGLCGTDGSSSFNAMHSGQSNPENRLQSFLLGPLS